MRNLLCLFAFMAISLSVSAQGITGIWKTIDDETGDPKSHIEIYEKDGEFFGRVVKLLPAATTETCDGCPDGMAGKSLLEVDIVRNLRLYKENYWSYGSIIDPAGGKQYKCSVKLVDNKLEVRGYMGIELLGRTQTWHPVQ